MATVTEPLPFRLLIDEAIKLTRRHFKQMFLPVALPVAVAQAVLPLLQGFVFAHGFFSPSPDPATAILGMVGFLCVAVLAGAVWGLGYGALVVAATEAQSGAGVSMGRAWLTMVRPRVFGTSLLLWMATMVGCMLCVLPGIFVLLLFSLTVPVMVAEQVYGTAALARGAALVRENPQGQFATSPLLRVFLILVIGYILSLAVGMVIQIPFAILQQIMMFREAAAGQIADPAALMAKMTLFQVPAGFLNALATTAVQVYMAFALSLFYFDLRRRQEGSDLEAAVQEMAGRETSPPPAVE
jgi:hypothetical protein